MQVLTVIALTSIVLTAIVAPFFPIPPVRIVATFPDKIKHAHEHIVLKHRSACLTLKPENICRLIEKHMANGKE